MKKRVAFLLLVILPMVLLNGCWSRREMSQLAIVMGVGVDRTPDQKVELTLQLAKPSAFTSGGEGGGGGTFKQSTTWVVSEKGDTIAEAEGKLVLKVPRQIYWAHNSILVIGEEMAQAGVYDIIDFFTRSPLIRGTMWIMVTKDEAKQVLNSHSELEKTSAQSLSFLARNKACFSIMLKDFIRELASTGTNPAATRVDRQIKGLIQGPGVEEPVPHEGLAITGTGIFKRERLAGWLDTSETEGMLWLRNEMKKGVITVPSPDQSDKKVSFAIIRGKTKVEPEYAGETIRFQVKITLEGDLLEQQSTEDLTTPEKVEAIEKAIAEDVIRKSRSALIKAQGEYGTDVFNFGEAFHRKYKKAWRELKEDWNEEFVKAEVDIAVEAHLRRTGLLTKPVTEEK